MDPNFNLIGQAFAKQYYDFFDVQSARSRCAELYDANFGMMTFEGKQFQGRQAIEEKLKEIPLDNMIRVISTIDCQPMLQGGIVVAVVGQLKNQSENDKPLPFSQTFVLKQENGQYFLAHDIFRLALHNV